MTSATFPAALGGDGSTVTDDADPTTGLANGGHRVRFVPALAQTVIMAQTASDKAAAAFADAEKTAEDRNAVASDKVAAQAARSGADSSANAAADSAAESAESATLAAQNAAAHYPSVADGIVGTASGQYFRVPENGYVQLYRNADGAAVPVLKLASQEALERLNARPDPLLTALLF